MVNKLSHKLLIRPGSSSGGATTAPRISCDFQIDGQSLLSLLIREDGGHSDFMGALVQDHPETQTNVAMQLTLQTELLSDSGRILLYVCPECGDIGCGAYGARVSRDTSTFTWSDFAYENGYEAARKLEHLGPFVFASDQYEAAIASASAL
jgi:hypothetical protein